MSVRVMTWVWDHSHAAGIDRLVLLAIADAANDNGGQAWPSRATLARKAGVDEKTVRRSVLRLVQLGELVVKPAAGPGGANCYRIRMRGGTAPPGGQAAPGHTAPPGGTQGGAHCPGAERPRGAESPRGGGTPPPEPSMTHPTTDPLRGSDTPAGTHAGAHTREDPPAARGTRLPDNWQPDTTLIEWARHERIPDDLARTETAKFRDHWHAQPGAKGRKADWPATWRNWMRRATESHQRPAPRASPPAGNPYLNDLRTIGAIPALEAIQ